jgi:hypothetical protein
VDTEVNTIKIDSQTIRIGTPLSKESAEGAAYTNVTPRPKSCVIENNEDVDDRFRVGIGTAR